MRCALKGRAPSQGPFGESLVGKRAHSAGCVLANTYHFGYLGFKSDAKARRECRRFNRTYGHDQICEGCLAERPNKNGDPLFCFKHFYSDAAHLMTNLPHLEFLQSSDFPSPWEEMPGFHYNSCFRDPMHTIYLGTAKDLLASCLGLWYRRKILTGTNLQEQVRWVSAKQKEYCKTAGLRACFRTFTPSNTGLDKQSEYPELGSCFKAATIKVTLWFFAKFSSEIATLHPEDWGWKIIKLFCNMLERTTRIQTKQTTMEQTNQSNKTLYQTSHPPGPYDSNGFSVLMVSSKSIGNLGHQ